MDVLLLAFTAALALISLGGGLYEMSVVDPSWPARLDIVQPSKGGILRRRFWIPAHVAFEICLLGSLFLTWHVAAIRHALLIAIASHATMRIWSAFDFIPKALRQEVAEPSEEVHSTSLAWVRRSRLRVPLDLVTCGATLSAFWLSASLA